MNRNFTQPFTPAEHTLASLVIEVEPHSFLQFKSLYEHEEGFYRIHSVKIDETRDTAQQLGKFLHDNGLELTQFQELARETSISYSFVDDTPGDRWDEVGFHVYADRTDRLLCDTDKQEAVFVSLAEMLENFETSPYIARVTEFVIAQLMNERETIG